MLTAILAAVVGVGVVAMAMVAILKREPRRARAGEAAGGGDSSWMFSPTDGAGTESGDCSGGDAGGGGDCGGDGGGGDGGGGGGGD